MRLTDPLEMQQLAADPFASAADAQAAGARLVDLNTLLRESDFVVICCALNEGTRHLINASRLALMKRTAYLINVARGPIVD
jgi:phosphoglycerate dehydrogenase-like enzyme